MRAVLFDLDGTLLDIDLPTFLGAYFRALAAAIGPHFPGVDVRSAVLASTGIMQQLHPGTTNAEAFHADFLARTGIDLDDPDTYALFEAFYADEFPLLRGGAGPRPGARRAVEAALEGGLSVVVATQPIFPRAAIVHRVSWAGLDDLDLPLLTTYEVMHACKPQPDYFREAAAMAGAQPDECVMVGDDRWLDMPAADVGMRTYYVGDSPAPSDWCGGIEGFTELVERLGAAGERSADAG